MKNLISIIIPVYNTELYLKKCIESVILQTYNNLEIILIDDGSTDKSYDIGKEYALKDSRIILLKQKNSGVSKARNLGIEKASGDWITFLDSDDWLEPNALEVLLNNALKYDADMVMANFFYNYSDYERIGYLSKNILRKTDINSYPLAILVPEASNYYDKTNLDIEIYAAACCKLTRKEIISKHHLTFNEKLHLGEDGLFHLKTFLKVKEAIVINEHLYHYRMHENSAIHKYKKDIENHNLDFYQNYTSLLKEIPLKFREEYKNLVSYKIYLQLIQLYIDHPNSELSDRKKIKAIKNTLSNPIYYISKIPSFLPFYKKIEVFCLKHKISILLLLLSKLKKILKK